MIRKARPGELAALVQLWQECFGGTAENAQGLLTRFAGLENVVVADEGDGPVGLLCAVPVLLGSRRGACLHGLCVQKEHRGRGLAKRLLTTTTQALGFSGRHFAVCIPPKGSDIRKWAEIGFEPLLRQRILQREISADLYAQADFSGLTARRYQELRLRYEPELMLLKKSSMAEVVKRLYAHGAAPVTAPGAVGLYLQKGDTLCFAELLAQNDAAAENLLRAAGQKTGLKKALITLGTGQELFLGEGRQQDFGLIQFLTKPFDVSKGYLRLMMEF